MQKGLFDVKHVKNRELLAQWQAAQLRAKEHELRAEFRVQLEEEKKKWSQTATDKAINRMTKACPKCLLQWAAPINCNHVKCHTGPAGGCGFEFCWICLCDYKQGKSAHEKGCSAAPWF